MKRITGNRYSGKNSNQNKKDSSAKFFSKSKNSSKENNKLFMNSAKNINSNYKENDNDFNFTDEAVVVENNEKNSFRFEVAIKINFENIEKFILIKCI